MATATKTTTAPLSTVIGVFPNHEQAEKAIDGLRQTNFSYERIRVVQRGTGSFGDTLKGMFTGNASMASSTSDNLVKMGMPEYEAQYYQRELDSDHVLVLMNADDRPEEAFSVMRQNGAFDINSRLRMDIAEDTAETFDTDGAQTAPQFNASATTPDVQAERHLEATQATAEPATPVEVAPANAPTSSDPDMARDARYSEKTQTTDDPAVSDDTVPPASDEDVEVPENAEQRSSRNA